MASAEAGYLVRRRRGLLTVVERVKQVHPHNKSLCTHKTHYNAQRQTYRNCRHTLIPSYHNDVSIATASLAATAAARLNDLDDNAH